MNQLYQYFFERHIKRMIIPFYPKNSMKTELVESEWSLVMKMNGHQSKRSLHWTSNVYFEFHDHPLQIWQI